MWTKAKPLLSLTEWCEVIGINPYLVAQIGVPASDLGIDLGQCENVFWQTANRFSDHLSREDIANAILQAETYFSQWALTHPAPKAESYEVLYPRPANLTYRQLWSGASGRLKTIEANMGNIISVGVYTETEIEANVSLTFSNPYGDAFDTQFSLSVTVPAGTTADEVVCYFSAGDIPSALSQSDCEVRPLKVTISGNTATIYGEVFQIVKLPNYLKIAPVALNATDATIFVDTLDVYRRTIDLTQSGTLYWDNDGCANPPCTVYSTSACFQETNKKQGYIAPIPALFDEATQQYNRLYPLRASAPDRVNLNVISGIPRDANGRMAEPYKTVIAYLATGKFIQDKTCGCAQADNIIYKLRGMPMRDDGTLEISQPLFEAVSGQFGVVNRATVTAYTQVAHWQNLRIHRSVTA